MRPVNLIPPEERSGSSAPLRTGAMPYIVLGVLGAALVIVFMLVSANNSIVDKENEIADLEVREQTAQQTATALEPYAQFATLEVAREQTISALATSRFDWSRVMNELALVTPSNVYLTDLTAGAGTVAGATAPAEGSAGGSSNPLAGSVTGPSISLSGCATTQRSIADYITDLETIDGVTRVGVDNTLTETDAAEAAGGIGDDAGAGADSGCAGGTSFGALIAFDDAPSPVDPATATAGPTATATPPATGEATTPTDPATPAPTGTEAPAPADGAQPASNGGENLR